jgi:hypothetical protein
MKTITNNKISAIPVARVQDFCVAKSRYYVLSCRIGGYNKTTGQKFHSFQLHATVVASLFNEDVC